MTYPLESHIYLIESNLKHIASKNISSKHTTPTYLQFILISLKEISKRCSKEQDENRNKLGKRIEKWGKQIKSVSITNDKTVNDIVEEIDNISKKLVSPALKRPAITTSTDIEQIDQKKKKKLLNEEVAKLENGLGSGLQVCKLASSAKSQFCRPDPNLFSSFAAPSDEIVIKNSGRLNELIRIGDANEWHFRPEDIISEEKKNDILKEIEYLITSSTNLALLLSNINYYPARIFLGKYYHKAPLACIALASRNEEFANYLPLGDSIDILLNHKNMETANKIYSLCSEKFSVLVVQQPCSTAVEIFKKIVEKGFKISTHIISKSFQYHNYTFLGFIFSKLKEDNFDIYHREERSFFDDKWPSLVNFLQKADDPKILALFSKHFPVWGKNYSKADFLIAIKCGRVAFVKSAFENEMKFNDEDGLGMKTAKEFYSLPLIKLLCENSGGKYKYPECLEPEIYKEKEILFGYAMNSPLKDIYDLCKRCPFLYKELSIVLQRISVLVRFPRCYQQDFCDTYDKKFKSYFEDSFKYADENNKTLEELLKHKSNFDSHHKLLQFIVSDRCKNDCNLHPYYVCFMKDNPEWGSPTTPVGSRYSWSLRHFQELLTLKEMSKNLKVDNFIKDENGIKKEPTFQYYYDKPVDDRDEPVMLTQMKICVMRPVWIHPNSATIIRMQNYLEHLHEKLINFKLNLQDPKSKLELHELIARGYWLMSTLCELKRGTPHNAMLWLNFMCMLHRLPRPIPKQEHFFLDNTMLMLPIQEVIKRWNTFFEDPLDKVVDRKELIKLLSQDGTLLQFCSVEAQNDKELQSLGTVLA